MVRIFMNQTLPTKRIIHVYSVDRQRESIGKEDYQPLTNNTLPNNQDDY